MINKAAQVEPKPQTFHRILVRAVGFDGDESTA
jgi:hypothetical protein